MRLLSFLRPMQAVVLLAAMAILPACAPAPGENVQQINFPGQPWRFQSEEIKLVNQTTANPQDAQFTESFPITLEQGLHLWTTERFTMLGGENFLQLEILESGVKRAPLPVKDGVKGLLTNEQSEQFTGTLQVALKLYNPNSAIAASVVEASAEQRISIAENASLAQRQAAYRKLVKTMIQQLDTQFTRLIPQYMQNYLN